MCARGLSGAPTELFTGSAESDLLTIRAYAAAVYRAVSDTAARLSYNKCKCVFFWSPQPPKIAARTPVLAHTYELGVSCGCSTFWVEGCTGHAARQQSRPRCLCAHTQEPFTHLEMGCGTTSGRHSPTIRQTQIDYIKKLNRFSLPPRGFTGRVGNNRASTVDVDICRQSRGRGTHTALAKALHAPLPEHPPGQLRK